ncbi:MAG: DUF2834 domain-containing protein [Thermodesulfobacteriota bacterium]
MSASGRKLVYLVLGVAGGVVPWIFAVQAFAAGHGLLEFIILAISNPAAAAVAADITISTFVAVFFGWKEARRLEMKKAWICLPLLCIALATSLAVFLWMRENRLAELGEA